MLGCVVIAAVLTGLTALLAPAGWFERLDGVVSDLAYPRGEPDPSVAVVAIDQRSLAEVDPTWPWSRARLADLVDALGAAGADAVALDLILAAPGDGDDRLAEAMQRTPTILGSASGTASSPPGRPLVVGNAVPLVPALADAAAAIGHVQAVADPADGVVRTVPVVVENPERQIVPSLSLAALAVARRRGSASHPSTAERCPGRRHARAHR